MEENSKQSSAADASERAQNSEQPGGSSAPEKAQTTGGSTQKNRSQQSDSGNTQESDGTTDREKGPVTKKSAPTRRRTTTKTITDKQPESQAAQDASDKEQPAAQEGKTRRASTRKRASGKPAAGTKDGDTNGHAATQSEDASANSVTAGAENRGVMNTTSATDVTDEPKPSPAPKRRRAKSASVAGEQAAAQGPGESTPVADKPASGRRRAPKKELPAADQTATPSRDESSGTISENKQPRRSRKPAPKDTTVETTPVASQEGVQVGRAVNNSDQESADGRSSEISVNETLSSTAQAGVEHIAEGISNGDDAEQSATHPKRSRNRRRRGGKKSENAPADKGEGAEERMSEDRTTSEKELRDDRKAVGNPVQSENKGGDGIPAALALTEGSGAEGSDAGSSGTGKDRSSGQSEEQGKEKSSHDSRNKKRKRERGGRSIRELHNNRVEEVRAAAEASAKFNKELIINVTSNEITIALLEDKKLVELNKEKCKTGFSVGDIYLGRVRKIMPGLNAAFISIGHEKDAFMHYLDLGPNFPTLHKLSAAVSSGKKMPVFETIKIEQPIGKTGKIGSYISSGQPIIVQIAKEAISTKGPRLTSEISLAGRHVVLIPFSNKISISQKIRSNEEKRRLRRIIEQVLPKNYGVIVRTAAVGKEDDDIASDIKSQVTKWENALEKAKAQQPPVLMMSEMNRAATIIRDLLNGSFSSINIDDKAMYEEIKEYIKQIAPEKEKIVKLYKGNIPIFDNFDISKQIQGLFAKYVSLKKGAYLIVEHTEALHVVDVNSGNRAKVDDDQEHTAMNVNLAAAEEVARQLRLRDMGGIIVVDFIDLHKSENKQLLYEKMQAFMSQDRAKHTILPLSKFGLMQITRQRVRPEAIAEISEVCPTCNGTGTVTPTALLDRQIENQVAYFTSDRGIRQLKIKVNPVVAAFLRKGFIPLYQRWALKYKARIKLIVDQSSALIEARFYDKDDKELI